MMKYGRYETLRELGRGSSGIVHEAYDPQIDRTVALKVLRRDCGASDAFLNRFLKEARTIGRLSHPNIVTVYDAGEDQGTVYIAMEHIEGQPLNQLMQMRRFSVEEVLELGIQMAETLDYAHSRGVVHRDIKPSNIVVEPSGRIKMTDFGIAHLEDPSVTIQTQDGKILGTPAYMSPEQVLGETVDGRSDLFSLGVILYQLCTGTKPFGVHGKTLATLFNEITHLSPPDPIHLNSEVTPKLSRVIMRCLSKTPQGRYSTGEELAKALRQCRIVEPIPPLGRVLNWVERKASSVHFLILVLLSGTALAASLFALRPETVKNAATLQARHAPPESEAESEDRPAVGPLVLSGGIKTHVVSSPLPHPATLEIESTPSGADVFVDGVGMGVTPLKQTVEPGEHVVALKRADHEDWEERIQVEEGAELPVKIDLKPIEKEPSLDLKSAPSRARVLINGVEKGKTPLKLKLPPGKHHVRVKLRRYKDWETHVELVEPREYPLLAQMKRLPPKPTAPPSPEEPSRPARLSGTRIIQELSPQNVWRRIRRLF